MAQAQNPSIGRAIFIGALVKNDPHAPAISREDATIFVKSILRTCNVCSSSNVKLCRGFIVRNILPSASRTGALGKYLVTLSKSFSPRDPEIRIDTTKPGDENEGLGNIVGGKVQQPPEPAFKRLHLIYLLHDVLAYTRMHQEGTGSSAPEDFRERLRPDIATLVQLAVCSCSGSAAKTKPAVQDVLGYWKKHEVFHTDRVDEILSKVDSSDGVEWEPMLARLAADDADRAKHARLLKEDETKWMLPERHGVFHDPHAPWHELPAANGLYMKRTRGYPLRVGAMPPGGHRLRNGGREASEELKKSISDLYTAVIHSYDKYTNASDVQDVDAAGHIIWKDTERPTRNYWGFTVDGIDRRKDLSKQFEQQAQGYAGLQDAEYLSAVERARMLAAERGRGMRTGQGTGMSRGRGQRRGGRW